MARLESCVGQCDRRVRRDWTGVELLREIERLYCGRERQVDVTGSERCVGAVEEVPGEPLRVVDQTRGCDRAVEHLACLRHPASNPEAASEHGDDEREEIALSDGTADPQRALGVRPCPCEVLEVELGRGLMRERVEPTADFVVRETVNEHGGVGGISQPLSRATPNRTCEGTSSERRCEQRLIAEQLGRVDRPASPGPHRVVVAAVEAVTDELDHQLDTFRGSGVSELGERSLEVGVRLVVPAEEVLDARTRSGEADAQRLCLLRDDGHALEECCVALPELAGGGERLGTGQQQLDAPVARRSRREETEGGREPSRSARGRTGGRRQSSLAQQRNRGLVALTRGAFDVVRDRRGQ